MARPRHRQHLTHCWCWAETDPDSIRTHLTWHVIHDAVEAYKIQLIAWKVALWGPPNKKRNPID